MRFPGEVARLYERAVDQIMARASGRSQYQEAVAYIQRMKQIGQHERANEVIARLKTRYTNRPALLDELKKAQGVSDD